MNSEMKEAIARANAIVEEMSEDYHARLRQHLAALEQAIGESDCETATLVAHTMKGEAGTFGWPLVSAAAGWLRQILEADGGTCDAPEVEVHVETLRLLIHHGMKGEHPEGQKLIRALYQVLEKEELTD